MSSVYIGILISDRLVEGSRIIVVSKNKEKVSQAIYKFFIFEDNIFSRIWSTYHSFQYEVFQRRFPEISRINRFEDRMRLFDNDHEYNSEFFEELLVLPTIEDYISLWGNYNYIIEEHDII